MDTELFLQLVLPGLTTGCIYALVALGFVLTANVAGVVNFAQGEYVMLGGVLVAWLVERNLSLWIAIPLTIVACACLSTAQERLTLAPVRASPPFIRVTITLGVAVVLRGLALIVFGKDPHSLAGFSGDGSFELGGAILPIQTLWVWGTTAALLGLIAFFLMTTNVGRAVRACSINPAAARLMGIDTERMRAAVFGVSGAIGGIAGIVIAPIVLANWDAGIGYSLKGFIGAVVGDFRSPQAAVLGAIGIGLVEALASGYVSSAYQDAIVYAALLGYLLVRGGIFRKGRFTAPSGAI